jgi:hypothetical protein
VSASWRYRFHESAFVYFAAGLALITVKPALAGVQVDQAAETE